jgi:hypothetical protein
LIYGFILRAIEQIRPSPRLLNDTMNLNDFVKIKLIDWKDHSMRNYVNGVVFTKSLDDRNMKNEFE